MMLNRRTAFAVTAFATLVAPPLVGNADPVVMVSADSMPQMVPEELYRDAKKAPISEPENIELSAVSLYHQLRKEFAISHTEMGNWLGVKRRTLYNWMKEPERATKFGPQIEERLVSLSALRDDMEPEHRPILFKIAFSPIYGDPKLGEDILVGAGSESLIKWYNKLYSHFESYRSMHSSKEQMT